VPADAHIEHFYLKIDGQSASRDIMNAIVSVEVDFGLQLPTMFSITLQNPGGRLLEDTVLEEGRSIEVSAEGEEGPVQLCTGKISAYEPEFTGGHQSLTVRGYDLAYGLYRSKHRTTYVQMTDSDIVQRIARDVGLQADVESTQHVHEYVFQNNLTHMEFLRQRARLIGYEIFVRGDTLVFRGASSEDDATCSLTWGDDFSEFHPRLSVAEQVDEVIVRGWNPATKSEVIGRAVQGQGAPDIGERRSGAAVASEVWGAASIQISDRPVRNQSQADVIAQAVLDERTRGFVTGDGVCRGNPAITCGSRVQIEGIGSRFSGTYYVTACTHRMSKEEGYVVRFSVSSRFPGSVVEMLRGPNQESRCFGTFVALVTNNNDPDNMGRVKVEFPWLDDEVESDWARIVTPMAGAERGILLLPEVGDEVLVAFEHGDISRPYVLGGLWNGEDAPPASTSDVVGPTGHVQKLVWKSRTGHTVILDDSDSQPGISICDKTGNNMVTFDSMKNSLTIEAAGDISIEAQGKVTIKGTGGVDVEGSPGQVNVKGTTINLN
jgi:phage protein D